MKKSGGVKKLSDGDVRKIKRRLRKGDTLRAIASDFDCCYTLIHHIKTGKRRADVHL